jgi:hypothetical protein
MLLDEVLSPTDSTVHVSFPEFFRILVDGMFFFRHTLAISFFAYHAVLTDGRVLF